MNSGRNITVLLADDHPLVVQGMQEVLSTASEFQIVAVCGDGVAAMSAIQDHSPNIAIVDINMPGMNGLAVLKAAKAINPRVRIVFLTASISDTQIFQAVSAGLDGLVLKDSTANDILICLHKVARGDRALPEQVVAQALNREAARREKSQWLVSELTRRQLEILRLIALGQPNKVVAHQLKLSEGTVKLHLHQIYQKLHVSNRAALTALVHSRTNLLS